MKLKRKTKEQFASGIIWLLCSVMVFPFSLVAQVSAPHPPIAPPANTSGINKRERIPVDVLSEINDSTALLTKEMVTITDTLPKEATDSLNAAIAIAQKMEKARLDSLHRVEEDLKYMGKERIFNPNPTRAVWMSALFPGLGQLYNRRYWKLPIVVGGFMGISYAVNWNGKMLTDYTKAYRDAMDNDPNTKSYMNFYPSTTKEEDIDVAWLQKTLKSKKDFYRRNRDLSIICMVGLYLICMVDAYVDASLSQFDISPDVSMQVYPTMIESNKNGLPSVGIQWALNF